MIIFCAQITSTLSDLQYLQETLRAPNQYRTSPLLQKYLVNAHQL